MKKRVSTIEVPWNYEVVGEHLNDSAHLLVLGDDGRFYSLNLVDGETQPAEISDEWSIDTCDLCEKTRRIGLN